MRILGRMICALGALAIAILAFDLLTGHAGFEFPGGVLRFLVLLPTAIVGSLVGFLMLRSRTLQRRARRDLLFAAVVPPVLGLAVFGVAQLADNVAAHAILVGALIVLWALYGAMIARGGITLKAFDNEALLGLLVLGVGIGLLIQSAGAAAGLIVGPDAHWPGAISFYGLCLAAGCMACVLILLTLLRHTRA